MGGIATGSGVTAVFRGTPLAVEKGAGLVGTYWSFGFASANPTNGDLVLKNASAVPVSVGGFAQIYTRRHLNVEWSPQDPRRGQVVTFDVTLTQAIDGDGLTAFLYTPDGQKTPISVDKVATGHWVGHATFSAVGDNHIGFITTGSRLRETSAYVSVASGDVELSSSFDVQVQDIDRDGLIDSLVLTPKITVPAVGDYRANATLLDVAGVEVASSEEGDRNLSAGSQPLALTFSGADIYKSGRWGPYTLRVTILDDSTTATTVEIGDQMLGTTAAYDYMQFQHDRIAFDPESFSSQAIDTNGDGLFDELDFTGTVTLENAGLYEINTSIYADAPWTYIAGADTKAQLVEGRNTFTLVFKGSDIAAIGRDGPYVESGLLCYLDSAPMGVMPEYSPQYKTAAYKASQFER